MQLRKIGKIVGAGSLSMLMAASTIGFATLDQYPQPFVAGGALQSLIVVGAAAQPSDVVGGIDFGARLGGETYTEVPIPGSAAIGTISGEGRSISTLNERIFLGDSLKKSGLRTALSDTDLPTVLKSGTVTDSDAGTTYDFDQFIDFPNAIALTFQRLTGKTPSIAEPTYLFSLDTSASATNSFYRTRIVFNDEVNVTSVSGEKMSIFGKEYTWASDSTTATGGVTKVVLLGSADTRTLAEGETVTTNIDGIDYAIKILSVGSATNVGVQVGSDSKSINKGSTASVGGIDINIDDVFFSSKEGTVSSAKLLIGARKVILTDATNVKTKIGSESEKTLDGTFVSLASSGEKLVRIDVYTQAPSSNTNFLAAGGTFKDTVWKSFSVAFPSVTSAKKGADRDEVDILPSGTKDTELTMTTDRGNRNTVKYGHLSSSNVLSLSDTDGDPIIVREGALIQKSQYFIVDSGDFSRMFELTSVSSLGTSDSQLTIRDVFSGNSIDVKLGSKNASSKVIDGQTYFFNASTATGSTTPNLQVTWGDASALAVANPGTFITVFPTLKTKNNARIALATNATLNITSASQAIQLPTGAVNLSYSIASVLTLSAVTTERGDSTTVVNSTGGTTLPTIANGASAVADTVFGVGKTSGGYRWYQFKPSVQGASNTTTIVLATGAKSAQALVGNATVLLVEEADDNNDVNSVAVDTTLDSSGGDVRTNSAAPDFSAAVQGAGKVGTGTLTVEAATDKNQNTDYWGTFSERDTSDQDKVRIWYPDDQLSASVFILGEGATVSTSGGTSGGTVRSAVPIKTMLAKLDSQVTASDKNTKHLILVGGPYVNTLVNDLASAAKTWTRAQWDAQGAGTAIVQLVNDAFVSGRSALVVSGFTAADTRTVTTVLQNFEEHKSTFAGKNLVVWKNGVVSSTTV